MLWIGLTGGIATGKSSVSRILVEKGIDVVDADVLAREVVQIGTDGYRDVIRAFGPSVVSITQELDRKKIANIVFSDPQKRDELERVIHPRVRALAEEKRRELEKSGRRIAFYDVPLLFEKKMQSFFDAVVVVIATPKQQVDRLMKRNGFSQAEAEQRLAAQMPISEKAAAAHYVIANDGDLTALGHQVTACLAWLVDHHAQT